MTKIDGKGNLFLKPEMLTTGSAVPTPWKSSLPKYIDGDGFPSGNKTGVQYKLTPVLPLSAPQNSPVEEELEVAKAFLILVNKSQNSQNSQNSRQRKPKWQPRRHRLRRLH